MEKIRAALLQELMGGLWHTTHPERFKKIIDCGEILPEPDMLNKNRWKASRGKSYYPYVRFLGGVSLFDFSNFNPESYSQMYPLSNWYEFVPCCSSWDAAVWIEIDRQAVLPNLISAAKLLEKWKMENAYKHTIMPHIEVAHLGAVPKNAFKRKIFVSRVEGGFHIIE